MSNAYTADGRRRSSMTHAKRGHICDICGKKVFGNGGLVAHGRSHVRRGEAIELLKEYASYPPMVNRVFLAPDDEVIGKFIESGHHVVELT